jgi:hypothetical protein
MIRRHVVHMEKDPRVVKWSLIAAVCALLLGGYAELSMASQADAEVPAAAVAGESAEAERPGITIVS